VKKAEYCLTSLAINDFSKVVLHHRVSESNREEVAEGWRDYIMRSFITC